MGNSCTNFSQTRAHGNSNNEVRDKETDEDDKRGVSMERSKADTQKKMSRLPITIEK